MSSKQTNRNIKISTLLYVSVKHFKNLPILLLNYFALFVLYFQIVTRNTEKRILNLYSSCIVKRFEVDTIKNKIFMYSPSMHNTIWGWFV